MPAAKSKTSSAPARERATATQPAAKAVKAKAAATQSAAAKPAAKAGTPARASTRTPAATAPTRKAAAPAPAAAKRVTAPVPVKNKEKAPAVPATKKTTASTTATKTSKAAKAAPAELETLDDTAAEAPARKKHGRPARTAAPAAAKGGAKRGRKPKAAAEAEVDDLDLSDIEEELEAEPEVAAAETAEKAKPLRMKISKAKERALMKEFGLDETVLSEEDLAKRRERLKKLIKLGKTRGYLTHGEISDHLHDKLVDAETLEVVVNMLNDMGVAVYEQTPDAEMLLLNNTAPTAATVEEAEEEAEAALSTVDSEFGRTTDPVRMYMREMGTVELLTREGEIEIAKRIEGGLMAMM